MVQFPELFSSREGRGLLIAVAASLLVHAVVLGYFLNSRIGAEPDTLPSTVSIRLVPANPLQAPVSDAPTSEELEPEEASFDNAAQDVPAIETAPIEVVSEDLPPEEIQQLIEPQPRELERPEPAVGQDVEQLAETPANLPIAPLQPLVDIPRVVLPSTDDLAQSIRAVQQQRSSRLWAYDCNPRQRESELITCDDREESRDAGRVGRFNAENEITSQTYQRFNPGQELSRAQRSLPTVSRNAPALAARLNSIAIPADLSAYLREEVEAGISHHANKGSLAADMQDRLTDQSDAAQQARQFTDDPWIRARIKPRLSTRVPTGN